MGTKHESQYEMIIVKLFNEKKQGASTSFEFEREELVSIANELNIPVPKNLGDILYSYRFRKEMPKEIVSKTPKGKQWVIHSLGRSKYRFVLQSIAWIEPNQLIPVIRIPDSTPGLIVKYSLNDEQALLAILRYNRLIDVFSGVACFSLQNHLRTSVKSIGQIETDEVYVGVDGRGAHFVLPVQAKSGRDKLNIIQIEQDARMCNEKFPGLECRCIATQFMGDNIIALFQFEVIDDELKMTRERHYQLVDAEELTVDGLNRYKKLNLND